ncbi:MAG TPA: glycosyltransferase 87 family protein [Streptosporangiaceae bacterium]
MNAGQLTVLVRRPAVRWRRWVRVAVVLAGLAALVVYLHPGLASPGTHWPLWDVRVYWWGGQQAARGGALYTPGARYSFTYPPFAAALFAPAASASEGDLAAVITIMSIGALAVLCALSLGAAGVRRRPETVFAVTALALLTCPVAYTLHLGEVNLIIAALAGTDLLRRHDGYWWQGIATGLAAGIKLTPLIFVAYLLITRRSRAAATAAATFAATVAIGFALLPSPSRVFWLDGVFYNQHRIGDPANPSDQSLSGAVARLCGTLDPACRWWAIAALLVGLAGMTVAAWAHRRGHRLAGVACCAVTGLLISPFSWTHHWVWAVPLLVTLAVTAWRRRSAGYGLAAAAAAAVFSGRIPLTGPGHLPGPAGRLEAELYVLCGLAVLAGTALALIRERAYAARRSDQAPGQSAAPRIAASSPSKSSPHGPQARR